MGSQKVVHWEERRDAVGSRAERAHPPRAPGREFRTRSRSRREAGPCAPARECAGVVRGSIRPVGACARRHFLQPPACVAVPVGSRARPPREMAPPGATGLGGAPPRPLLAPAARGRAKTTLGPAGHLGPPWAPASLPRPRPPPSGPGADAGPRARADLRAERRMGAREEKSRGGGGGGGPVARGRVAASPLLGVSARGALALRGSGETRGAVDLLQSWGARPSSSVVAGAEGGPIAQGAWTPCWGSNPASVTDLLCSLGYLFNLLFLWPRPRHVEVLRRGIRTCVTAVTQATAVTTLQHCKRTPVCFCFLTCTVVTMIVPGCRVVRVKWVCVCKALRTLSGTKYYVHVELSLYKSLKQPQRSPSFHRKHLRALGKVASAPLYRPYWPHLITLHL